MTGALGGAFAAAKACKGGVKAMKCLKNLRDASTASSAARTAIKMAGKVAVAAGAGAVNAGISHLANNVEKLMNEGMSFGEALTHSDARKGTLKAMGWGAAFGALTKCLSSGVKGFKNFNKKFSKKLKAKKANLKNAQNAFAAATKNKQHALARMHKIKMDRFAKELSAFTKIRDGAAMFASKVNA